YKIPVDETLDIRADLANGRLLVHPTNTNPTGFEGGVINVMANQSLGIIFANIFSNLLPAPYPSTCLDYSDSQKSCLDNCIVQKIVEKLREWPGYINAPWNTPLKFAS